MMRRLPYKLFFLIYLLPFMKGCTLDPLEVDVSGIEADVRIERFDRFLFQMDQDSMNASIGSIYEKYGDFFDIFNVHIINIGPASARRYPSYLSMFLNDPTNQDVFNYVNTVFASTENLNSQLTDGFRHYLYHYPDSILPRVIGYVSRFNLGLFTVDHFVGIGLDQYLGSNCSYYEQIGDPAYLSRNKVPERIPVDVMVAWATQIYPYNDSLDNVLSRMIYEGLLVYFVDAMYPDLDENLKMGFTDDQMKWCHNNEKQMWTHLVEEKLLFSSDQLVIRKLVGEAPNTTYFTGESPGRAAVWQGRQIVGSFVKRYPEWSLHRVMSERNYQELLRRSHYNP